MCGESHPSILFGSIGMMSCCIGLIRRLKEKISITLMKRSLYAPHGSEMEEVDYSEEDSEPLGPDESRIPYLPGRYEENEKS